MIYPPNQKPPIWSIDPGVIAYNCQLAGMPHPSLALPMWEGAGTRVMDYSGNGNHGTLYAVEWTPQNTISFAGETERITLTSPISFAGNMSIHVIYKLNADTYYGGLIGDDAANDAIEFNNHAEIRIYESDSHSDFDGWGFNLNQWYSLVITRADNVWRGWMDGIEDTDPDSPSTAGALTLSSFGVGHDNQSIKGELATAHIFEETLTEYQAKLLHYNPYFMYQIPEELYGYVTAVAGISIPSLMQQMNQFDGGTYALC